MTFEDRIDQLLENGFYIHRVCGPFGLKKFHIMIGKKVRLYVGEGDTLSDALTEAVNNYEKGETWPPAHLRTTSSSTSYEELDGKLKDLGIDLN